MTIIKACKRLLVKALEWLRGSSFVRIIEPDQYIGSLTAHSVSGYRIDIYCEKRCFERRTCGFIKSTLIHCIFMVRCTVSLNAPKRLRDACELEMVFPKLVNASLDDNTHLQAVINAYLDVLKNRLDAEHKLVA